MLQYKFEEIYGDDSGDGHGMTTTVYGISNKSYDEMKQAYSEACAEHGIDMSEECEEYESNSLSTDCVASLLKAGVLTKKDCYEYENEEYSKCLKDVEEGYLTQQELDQMLEDGEVAKYDYDYTVGDCEDLVNLGFKIAKLKLPDLEWKLQTHSFDNTYTFPFGISSGYGLF